MPLPRSGACLLLLLSLPLSLPVEVPGWLQGCRLPGCAGQLPSTRLLITVHGLEGSYSVPPLFSRLNSSNPFNLSSWARFSIPLIIPVTFCWMASTLTTSLPQGGDSEPARIMGLPPQELFPSHRTAALPASPHHQAELLSFRTQVELVPPPVDVPLDQKVTNIQPSPGRGFPQFTAPPPSLSCGP